MSEIISKVYESPSYIREVLGNSETITLFFRKVIKLPSTSNNDETHLIDVTNTSLDLTGNPLEVDLTGDELGNLPPLSESKNWTDEESRHFPITLREAGKIINNVNKCRIKWEQKVQTYVYCICDGSDLFRTVVLGAKQSRNLLCRTQIFVKGCFMQTNPLISVKCMEQEHRDNVGIVKSQDQCLVTSTYVIYGRIFKNCPVMNTRESTGCISLELKWNDCEYAIPKYVLSAQMNLQVIAGHKDSPMYMFWTQLSLLSNYIAILSARIADFEWVCHEPRDYTDISNFVYLILHGSVRPLMKKNFEKTELNMHNLRHLTLTDKLWNLLIHCNSVGDLRSCFHVLFQELIAIASNKIDVSEDNKTTVANVIRDIVCGKLAVPTLTSKQCLEFLIELGIEKLKADYFYVINYFDGISYEKLLNYWSLASQTDKLKSESLVGNLPSKAKDAILIRKTRLILLPSTTIISDVEAKDKLSCLVHMHLASDFLLLTKNYCSMREAIDSISRCVQDSLLIKESPYQFYSDLPDVVLHELKVKLKSTDTTFLETLTPATWNLKLTSIHNRSTVLTIFHLTRKPIFPPSIYDNYDIPVGAEDEQIYFVTKLVRYIENIG